MDYTYVCVYKKCSVQKPMSASISASMSKASAMADLNPERCILRPECGLRFRHFRNIGQPTCDTPCEAIQHIMCAMHRRIPHKTIA